MKIRKIKHFQQFLAATLAVSSSFGIVAPVIADTAAGQAIKNTATATFKDDDENSYNSTSNEVVITVAEVASIMVKANTPSVTNPNAGDTLFIDYVITNNGNDPTQFFIPGNARLSNTTAFEQDTTKSIQIVAVNLNGTPVTTSVNVPKPGDITTNTTGKLLQGVSGTNNGSIPPGGTITVRVPIKVLPTATAGQILRVSLGETANPPDLTDSTYQTKTQNQDRTGNEGTKDVYTVDNADGTTGETNGAPVNGVREAMATSDAITVNARQQAFSTVLKAVSSYSTGAKPNDVSDDVLTYGLALKVENPTSPSTGLVASDLYGTEINVDNSTSTPYVLVSDAIPTRMKLGAVDPNKPNNDWQVVYTTDDLSINALNAKWFTIRPPSGIITRVGFIYNTNTKGPLPKGGPAITGFNFTVTPDASFTGGQIANIAQTFGQSQPGKVKADTATQIVYDESGDKTPNNGLDGANPDPTTGGVPAANGGITNGKADPTADGTDPGSGNTGSPTAANTNTGTDGNGNGSKTVGGEDNVYVIAVTPLNGPKNLPEATGPSGTTNDDFTNKSIQGINKPSDKSLTDAETPIVTFENTVENTSGSPQDITLLPTPPTGKDTLIDGTKVTITANGQTASYTYTAGAFVPDSGTTAPVKVTVSVVDPSDPTKGFAQYTVQVDLPGEVSQFIGYSVPITAFVDVNNDKLPDGEPSNITIDRVYTNYLKLQKEARLLETDGTTPVAGTAGSFTTDPKALAAAATPGRVIEYRITYTNVSINGGKNSVTLPANDLTITEDGAKAPNNWFNLTYDPQLSQPDGSALADKGKIDTTTRASNGTDSDGKPINNDIKVYINKNITVVPGDTGIFKFQRKIK